MVSRVVFFLLVGLAASSSNSPGWRENKEYVYKVHGRTLASLSGVARQYSGIFFKAELRIQPKSDDELHAQLSSPEYSPVHSELSEGLLTNIPDDQLSWQRLELSSKPFKMIMKYGVITDLVVSREIPNWEANLIKGIVSQFQLNTNGHNLVQSNMNSLSQDQESALFKTMEETITGKTETLYTINPVPEYIAQQNPWFKFESAQEGEEGILEVTKSKNYTNAEELPANFYGFGQMEGKETATNRMGRSFTRSASTHAILTGSRNRYTIQHSVTVNVIGVNPTLNDKQEGSVTSSVNVTLKDVRSQFNSIEDVSNPLSLGSLVYRYENPFGQSNQVRERRSFEEMRKRKMMENDTRKKMNMMDRFRRSIDSQEQFGNEPQAEYYQDRPQLNEAPPSPLLPFTAGYKGRSIKQAVDVSNTVRKLAVEIAEAEQQPEELFQKEVLSKFLTMTSLVRLMDTEEIQKTASQLYSQSEHKVKRNTWEAFRDAVAKSGTGPALHVIQSWIQEKKIKGNEASQVLSTMSHSVRQPTLEYMKSYFEWIKSSPVQSQWPLNDTAVLKFSELVHQVYINKDVSRKQFPIHSYGSFYSQEGKEFAKQTVIPYLSSELHKAIASAQTHKIYVYLGALSRIAHPQILSAYEPYLEGQKQASQFQRFVMVLSLRKLAGSYPEQARSVMFKIYKNLGETQEVRVAAAYVLMETHPPTEMVQHMATLTNYDEHDHVSAVVKSLIENYAVLEAPEFHSIRLSAQSAMPLLTKKSFGIQYGGSYIHSYFDEESNRQYNEILRSVGNQDEFYPRDLKYSLSENLGGMKRNLVSFHAVLSSVKDLVRELREQTESYKQQKREQERNFEEQQQHPWSSQKIARLLNIKPEEREQLEGWLSFDLDGPFQMFLPFDNNTIREFSQVLRTYESAVKSGIKIDYSQFYNHHEISYSMPTETGLPALFSYDNPKLIQLEGKIRAQSQPQLFDQEHVQMPKTLQMRSDLGFTVTSKIQGQLSFTTPFDHQRYMAGYDKEWQIHLPLHGNIEIDVEKQQVKAEYQPQEKHEQAHLFQYRTRPYTSKFDITNFQPVTTQSGTKFFSQQNLRNYERTFGKKETGLALKVHYQHERRVMDLPKLFEQIFKYGFMNGFIRFWDDASIQYSQLKLRYLPEESSVDKVVLYLRKQGEYKEQPQSEGSDSEFFKYDNPAERQNAIIRRVASGIKNVKAEAYDATVEFQGRKTIKHTLTGAVATSDVDPKSKVLISYRKQSNDHDVKPYLIIFEVDNHNKNTQTLDMKFALESEPAVDTNMAITFGPSQESSSRIKAQLEFRRSEERQQYLMEQPEYYQAERDRRQGNWQSPAALNMTIRSALLDKVTAQFQYANVDQEFKTLVQGAFNLLRYRYYPTLEVDDQQKSGQNELWAQARFDPDLKSINVSVRGPHEQVVFRDIMVPEFAKQVLVVHPIYRLNPMMMQYAFGLQSYRPTLVVDQTMLTNFNNVTYPVDISRHWTVLLQYIPKQPRYQEQAQYVWKQLKYQPENYIILVRKNKESSEKKDIKITLSTPETQYKVIDITLTPCEDRSSKARVEVNGQQVQIQNQQSHDIANGVIKIYSLANGEVKVGIKNAFYVIYDGHRARVSVVNGKFKDAVRGLGGQFNDERVEDLLTSENYFARDFRQFVKSYEVEGEEGEQLRSQILRDTENFVEKQVPRYVDVVSDIDAKRQDNSQMYSSEPCTRFQTRYMEQNGEICFTIRALPVCSSQCQQRGSITKPVPVHCIQKSNVAQIWRNQIDKGASPDFSHKKESKTISMMLPQSCSESLY